MIIQIPQFIEKLYNHTESINIMSGFFSRIFWFSAGVGTGIYLGIYLSSFHLINKPETFRNFIEYRSNKNMDAENG